VIRATRLSGVVPMQLKQRRAPMTATDTNENGLESLIVAAMAGRSTAHREGE